MLIYLQLLDLAIALLNKEYPIKPEEVYFSKDLNEFLLPYEAVRTAKSPDDVLMAFTQSTYEAAANLAKWDRHELKRMY